MTISGTTIIIILLIAFLTGLLSPFILLFLIIQYPQLLDRNSPFQKLVVVQGIQYALKERKDRRSYSSKVSEFTFERRINELPTSNSPASVIKSTASFQYLVLQYHGSPQGTAPLTLDFLSEYVIPFLESLIKLQNIIHSIRGRTDPPPILIKQIRHYNPIETIISGITDALRVLWEDIVPYRREHIQKSAKLDRQGKASENRITDAEADQAKAKADVATLIAQAEANKAEAEAERTRAETVKLQAEAQKTLAEARQIDITSAMSIVESYGAHLPPEQKLALAAQLIPLINTLMLSPLEPVSQPTD